MKLFLSLAFAIVVSMNSPAITLAGILSCKTSAKETFLSSGTVKPASYYEREFILVDGSIRPTDVPDTVAYSLLFRFLSGRKTEEEKRNATAYIKHYDLGNPEELLQIADEYAKKVDSLEKREEAQRSGNSPTKSFNFQVQKDGIIQNIINSLPVRLTNRNGVDKILTFIQENMKSKIKIYRANSTDRESNSLYKRADQRFAFSPISSSSANSLQTSGQTINNYGDGFPVETEGSAITVGFGVSEINFYYGQPTNVRTTINSPDGRSVTITSQGTTYTRAETSLPIYSQDVPFPESEGEIQIPITFSIFFYGYGPECYRYGTEGPCPFYRVYYTTISIPIRVALDAYELLSETFIGGRFGYGVCDYDATCFGFCSLTAFGVDKVNKQRCPRYTQCRTIVFRNTCLNIAKLCVGSLVRGTCSG